MSAQPVLDEFRKRRKLLSNVGDRVADERLRAMWGFLEANDETREIIAGVPPFEKLIMDASPEKPVAAGEVDKVDIDFCIGHLLGDLAQLAGLVLNIDDEHLADGHDGDLVFVEQCLSFFALVKEHMQNDLVLVLGAADTFNVDAGFAQSSAETGKHAGAVGEHDGKILCHLFSFL